MKFRMKKITALMAAAVLGASTFGGVSVMAAESTEAMAVPADQAGMVVDDDAVAAEGDAIPSDFIQAFLHLPQRMHSALFGFSTGLTSIWHAFAHFPQ